MWGVPMPLKVVLIVKCYIINPHSTYQIQHLPTLTLLRWLMVIDSVWL